MATYTTYSQVGQAEDVSEIITNISPTKTPFQSAIGEEKVTARNPEWQEDSLADVTDNALVEGADASEITISPTTMRTNYTQIIGKAIKVSGTSDAVDTHGRQKETAYQLVKVGEEVKRDRENAYVGTGQAAAVGDATSSARKMAGVQAQVDASLVFDNSGTPRALDEALVLAAHEALYSEGGDPSMLLIKPADAPIVAGFAAASDGSRIRDFGDGTKVVNAVEILVTPFGELKVVIDRFIKSTDAVLFDPDMWSTLALRNWTREPLAKVGDSERNQLIGEFSLKHKNYKASAVISDLS